MENRQLGTFNVESPRPGAFSQNDLQFLELFPRDLCLPVFDGDELIGLISVRDALNEMVDQQKFMISQLEHYITGGGR